VVLLELPRTELYRRIDARVELMIADGLLAEVRELLRRGYGPGDPGMNATGYIELVPHLCGERSLAEAITLIQNATRGFARRQLTWFRQQLAPGYITLDAGLPPGALAERILEEWGRAEN
jgi:tRNA dimethylallyltransferase